MASLQLRSRRQRQVLYWLSEGKSISETATILSISVKTASTYRQRLLEELGLENTAQLMRYAIDQGVSDPDQPAATAGRARLQLLKFTPKAPAPAAVDDEPDEIDRIVARLQALDDRRFSVACQCIDRVLQTMEAIAAREEGA